MIDERRTADRHRTADRMRLSGALFALLAALAFTAGACSSSDGSVADPEPSTAPADAEGAGDDTTAPEETDDDPQVASDLEPELQVFAIIATEPTEAGAHPLLMWDVVDGAAGYDLIVLDAEGVPYWAWSGDEPGVHLGGVANADAAGAWVFETLTWIVTARDASGEPLAMSEKAELLP